MCFANPVSSVNKQRIKRALLLIYDYFGGVEGQLIRGAYNKSLKRKFKFFYAASLSGGFSQAGFFADHSGGGFRIHSGSSLMAGKLLVDIESYLRL